MPKIIKTGVIPEEREIRMTCNNCKTVFDAQRQEFEMILPRRAGAVKYEIACPLCNIACYADCDDFVHKAKIVRRPIE